MTASAIAKLDEAVVYAVGENKWTVLDQLEHDDLSIVDQPAEAKRKIVVFLGVVLTSVLIAGALMYVIEGEENGFTSIPASIYWAVSTISTVGFGDIVPHTPLGRFVASVLMILGYAIIAVPTGIVTVELSAATRNATNTQACPSCGADDHDNDAVHCKHCGAKL